MAVRLVKGVEQLIDKGSGLFIKEVVATARGFAPVESGNLAASISGRKVSLGKYIVSTNAVGRNGFEYPLHIEFGKGVKATRSKDGLLHFVINGNWISKPSVKPSAQNHFVKKTISKYGGIYTGK